MEAQVTAERIGTAARRDVNIAKSSSMGVGSGGGAVDSPAKKRKQGEDRGEITEEAGTITIELLPDEILLKVLSLLFGMTLMRYAPQVCKR